MHLPALALLWEVWRTKRGMIFAVIAMSLVGGYGRLTQAIGSVPVTATPTDPDPALFFSLRLLSLLLLFGICNYTESGDGRGFGGFPKRLFTLPVSTLKLVALPILAGVVVVELHYLVWMDRTPSEFTASPAFYGVILGATVVFYQVALWMLERLKSMKLVVLGLLGVVMLAVSQLPMVSFLDDSIWGSERFLMLLVSAIATSAFLVGWGYVSRLRCGQRGQPGTLRPIARLVDALPSLSRRFATPAGAQAWFEWRTVGVILPLVVAGVIVLIIAPLSWLLLEVPDAPSKIGNLVVWTLVMPVLLAHPIGIVVAKPTLSDRDLSLPAITATKPMTTAELVAIRIRILTLSVVVAWAIVLIFLAVLPLWTPFDGAGWFAARWQALTQQSMSSSYLAALVVLGAMFLTWRFMVSSLWIGLSGSKGLFNALIVMLVSVLPIIYVVMNVARLPNWLAEDPGRVTALAWLMGLAVVAKYGLAVMAWRKPELKHTRGYLLVAIAGTACFVVLALTVWDGIGRYVPPAFGHLQAILILVALLLVPVARPGFTPAMLARNRHRA